MAGLRDGCFESGLLLGVLARHLTLMSGKRPMDHGLSNLQACLSSGLSKS